MQYPLLVIFQLFFNDANAEFVGNEGGKQIMQCNSHKIV
jgi:hypothetical protein